MRFIIQNYILVTVKLENSLEFGHPHTLLIKTYKTYIGCSQTIFYAKCAKNTWVKAWVKFGRKNNFAGQINIEKVVYAWCAQLFG